MTFIMKSYFRGSLIIELGEEVTIDMKFLPISVFQLQFQLFPIAQLLLLLG